MRQSVTDDDEYVPQAHSINVTISLHGMHPYPLPIKMVPQWRWILKWFGMF